MNDQNPSTQPTLPQCGPEQDPNTTIARPSRGQKRSRTETKSRHTWSKDDNIQLRKLYYQSNPSRTGYRRRHHSLWMDAPLFHRSEQQLADQARSIRNNNLLSDIELLEIQGNIPQVEVFTPPHQDSSHTLSHQRSQATQNLAPSQRNPTVSQTIRSIRQNLPDNSTTVSPPLADMVPSEEVSSLLLEWSTDVGLQLARRLSHRVPRGQLLLAAPKDSQSRYHKHNNNKYQRNRPRES